MEEKNVRMYVGIDWATEEHQVCALAPSGRKVGERVFKHDAHGLHQLCSWLLSLSDGDPGFVWVGIEVLRGAVVETLLEKGFAVFAINPKQMDRFRDRFTVAGAKDDRLDALVIGDSLRTDAHLYRRLELDEPAVIELTADIGKDWFLDLWALVPTPAKARRVRPRTVDGLLRARQIRSLHADEVLAMLRDRTPYDPARRTPRTTSRVA